jgi:succinyl-diaminopimelate desuccinylase
MSVTPRVDADAALGEAFLLEILSSLVRTPSVNPGTYECAMADRVRGWVDDVASQVSVVEFAPGRPSVAAVLEGAGDGPRLVLNGHMDTVPVDDESRWTSDPFDATVRDGYVYGRGACDMKAGLAVQIAVLHHLAALGRPLRGSLVTQFAAGEECAEPGTLSLLQAGFTGDYGIVTEPTQVSVAVAERGLCHYRIRIVGQSIHASRAHLGVNPVLHLREVLDVLEAYDAEAGRRAHPLLPGSSVTPTIVRAGVKENAVADTCDVLIDRRLLPGETVEGELEALRARLEPVAGRHDRLEIDVSVHGLSFEPAEIPAESEFARRVAAHAGRLPDRTNEVTGTPYASDVRNLVNDAGMEAITFGPGWVAECHCIDERVAIRDLTDAADVIAAVARELLL